MIKVIAFGAGNFYKSKKEDIEKRYEIIAFCDNDVEKIGTIFDGKPVISINELTSYQDLDILITSTFKYEIIAQLIEEGISEERIHLIAFEWLKNCERMQVCAYVGGGYKGTHKRTLCNCA